MASRIKCTFLFYLASYIVINERHGKARLQIISSYTKAHINVLPRSHASSCCGRMSRTCQGHLQAEQENHGDRDFFVGTLTRLNSNSVLVKQEIARAS
eukprot:scaffold818_cov388-Pavlova_lutheri.AAC.21